MKKALITGGAGFIGSNLSLFLLNKNFKVWTIDNLLTSRKGNINSLINNKYFKFIEADITNSSMIDEIKNISFDYIFHLASPASPQQYSKYPIETLMVNSVGTKNILDIAKLIKKCVVIYSSTSEVYGDPLVHPQKESYWGNVNSLGERACYDEAKRFGEALCMSYYKTFKIDVRIARIFNTFGPNMEKNDGRVISNFINQALENKPITIYGNGQQTRSFCYISDMVKGLYKLANVKSIHGETINLGNNNELKIVDIARIIKKITKSKSKIEYRDLPPDDPKKRKPDLFKSKHILDWMPEITLEDGLKKTISYYQQLYIK